MAAELLLVEASPPVAQEPPPVAQGSSAMAQGPPEAVFLGFQGRVVAAVRVPI